MKPEASSEIYLDANATTPVLPVAAQDAFAAMEELYGNPSSSHITGLRARYILETARNMARAVLGAPAGRIVFTSGATEAIQTAIFSVLCHVRESHSRTAATEPRCLLYGATEHKAVPQALKHWNTLLGINSELLPIPVDRRGQLDLGFLREHARRADLVCTMAVNNETGVIHDLAQIESVLREANEQVAWMVDCVQALAKIDLRLSETTIDYAPLSGHKLYAPKGIGMLYVREGLPLVPLLAGGGQEGGARGGTENLPGVAALSAVLKRLADPQDLTFQPVHRLREFRDRLAASLKKAFPSIVFNAPFEHAVPTTINFSVKGFSSKEILDLFDAAGIRVSSGSACGSAIQGSYVLEAMGLPIWQSDGAIRVSFGPVTTDAEISAACQRIEEAGRALCESCLIVSDDLDRSHDVEFDGLVQLKKNSMCSYVLLDSKSRTCVVIDPFEELADRIESLIRCQKSRVLAILDTHQHVDHQSCREMLLQVLGSHTTDLARTDDLLGWPDITTSSREHPVGLCVLADGSPAEYVAISSSLVMAKSQLPGHTVDGVVYLVGQLSGDNRLEPEDIQLAFSGDTLQIGGIGRTDFYSSSAEQMLWSLRRLPRILSPATLICPTHDYSNGFATTLAAELRGNEFLRRAIEPTTAMTTEQFVAEKAAIDAQIDDARNCELVCGHIQVALPDKASLDIRPDEIKTFFATHPNWTVVDVREPHEFRFAQHWEDLGLRQPPENVPLTRLSHFLNGMIQIEDQEPRRDIVFVCRSGNRSSKAAEVARRLGIQGAWHITGGIALGLKPHAESLVALEEDAEYVI